MLDLLVIANGKHRLVGCTEFKKEKQMCRTLDGPLKLRDVLGKEVPDLGVSKYIELVFFYCWLCLVRRIDMN